LSTQLKIGQILSFPQMLEDPDWRRFGELKYEGVGINEKGEASLKMITEEPNATH